MAPKTAAEYYIETMNACAQSKTGILLVLPPGTPLGDFVFGPHKWTRQQIRAWQQTREAPVKINALPMDFKSMPQVFHGPDHCKWENDSLMISDAGRKRIKETSKAQMDIFMPDSEHKHAIPRSAMDLDELLKEDN